MIRVCKVQLNQWIQAKFKCESRISSLSFKSVKLDFRIPGLEETLILKNIYITRLFIIYLLIPDNFWESGQDFQTILKIISFQPKYFIQQEQ